jgi:hypothetical protein
MEQLSNRRQDHGEVEIGSDRSFGFVFAAAFCVVAFSPLLRGRDGVRWWAVAVAVGFFVLALAMPSLLHRPKLLWFRLGSAIHRVMSPVVMALIFVGAIVPVGVLARLCGKDFLRLRREPEAESYWLQRRPPGPEGTSLRDQF